MCTCTMHRHAGSAHMFRIKQILAGNQVTDVALLAANAGLASGDRIDLTGNPLSAQACEDVKTLRGRGANVYEDACPSGG